VTRIIKGVFDFQKRMFQKREGLFQELARGQKPLGLFITCSDSRINPNLLTMTEPGELFILRNAGNLVPPFGGAVNGEEATIEYAVAQLKVQDVILCGHTHCGAMHGLLEPAALAKLPRVAAWLEYAKAVVPAVERAAAGLSPEMQLTMAIEQNVLVQLGHLRTHPSVAEAVAAGRLRLHGWVYHIETGKVDAHHEASGRFLPLEVAHWKDHFDRTPAPASAGEFDDSI
jgi:carbonic anhydrase